MKTNKKAFSLVELLVVISIIAVLAGLVFAVMRPAMKSTKDTASINLIKNLYVALETYKNEVGYYPEPQSNYFISNKSGGGNQILKDPNFRKYFSLNFDDLDNDTLTDAYGNPIIYIYKTPALYTTATPITTTSTNIIFTSPASGRHQIDIPSDMTHEIFIYSCGSDSKDDTDKEIESSDDLYAVSTK